jgi:hypothetical protein
LLQVPAAAFFAPGTDVVRGLPKTSGGILVREPDTQAAASLMAALAQHNHWTGTPTTVDGTPAVVYAHSGGAAAPEAVEAVVQGVMVITTTTAALDAVIKTAQGTRDNLGQSASFTQLVSAAPGGAAATIYLNTQGMQTIIGQSAKVGATAQGQATATLFTLVWDTSALQGTLDVAMP